MAPDRQAGAEVLYLSYDGMCDPLGGSQVLPYLFGLARRRGVAADRLMVRPASRDEVPRFIAAADYGLFFIMPVFSKKASSPTKWASFSRWNCRWSPTGGSAIMEETGAGVVVSGFNAEAYREALDRLEQLRPDMDRWRAASRRWLDLEAGVERYDALYRSLANAPVGSRGSIGQPKADSDQVSSATD